MNFWDFLSDFIQILNELFNVNLFSVQNSAGSTFFTFSLFDLLGGIFVISALVYYLIPRR